MPSARAAGCGERKATPVNPPHLHPNHTAASTPAAVDEDRQVLQIRFTGQGRDDFWVWAGNLLRLVATLGLYYPFAQARRRRYFHAHTLVDGHALAYHGSPRSLLWHLASVLACALTLACVLLFGLALLTTQADTTAHRRPAVAGAVGWVVLVTLWPALWHASLHHRLANTSWRGLRLRFTGDVAGAYRALLPRWLPAALLLVLVSVPAPQTRQGAAAVQWVFDITSLAMLA